MPDTSPNIYDEVLYPNNPLAQAHPDRLATLAILFGMNPAPVDHCRVLELGCGNGGNLIPLAFTLPESDFVGIDLAALPVAKGQETIATLKLKNIALQPLDLMQIAPDFGQFDYIICHGLYSWTPPPVRDHILAICKANLTARGVAYVSYNVHPGNHIRHMVREMMLFHVQQFGDPPQRIEQAKALIKFLIDAQPVESDPYGTFLKKELERTMQQSHGSLFHDDLAEVNDPVYFHEFARHAAAHDLQYLAEADFFEMQDQIYPSHITDTLRALSKKDILLKEQYLDFIKCRRFRQTLLCHAEMELDRTPQTERLQNLYVASSARPVSSEPEITSSAVEEFRGPKGSIVATDHPLAKATMLRLSELWPQTIGFNQLLTELKSRLEQSDSVTDGAQAASALGDILTNTYAVGLIELHTHPFHFATKAGERPIASPLARVQAQTSEMVTNLRHESVRLEDDLVKHLLLLLDGTRDREMLLNELRRLIDSGEIDVEIDNRGGDDSSQNPNALSDGLERSLENLARLALLIA